jgi:hypothetical protein
MQDKNKRDDGRHENPLPQEISQQQKGQVEAAHEEAMHDIEEDAELSAHSPNDDLDEGETARLGEGKNPLV